MQQKIEAEREKALRLLNEVDRLQAANLAAEKTHNSPLQTKSTMMNSHASSWTKSVSQKSSGVLKEALSTR